MKKDGIYAQRIYPLVFMALLTIVFITGVSGLFLTTKERVELNETIVQKKAVLYAVGIEYPENDPVEVTEIYAEQVKEIGGNGRPAYFEVELPDGGSAYAVYVEGPGLWGQIVTIFGFEEDLSTITGMEVVRQNETPGLGARIKESWFKEQFRGSEAPFTMVPEGTAAAADELDAITGATKTSAAMERIANKARETAEKVIEEDS
jgi:Na+-transporting NADH:ubiquinone oxidoreductase subunit C